MAAVEEGVLAQQQRRVERGARGGFVAQEKATAVLSAVLRAVTLLPRFSAFGLALRSNFGACAWARMPERNHKPQARRPLLRSLGRGRPPFCWLLLISCGGCGVHRLGTRVLEYHGKSFLR